jgi:hypothetical protein
MVFNKSLAELVEADLQRLIDEQQEEVRTLDYKALLPAKGLEDRKEFAADVVSFANSGGGWLIFGMRAEKGVPKDLIGLPGVIPDDEILRLENMLRDGIEPRIPGVAIGKIPLSSGSVAILVHIPLSWAKPHMVKLQGSSRFFARSSAGKYQLDVAQIRAAFLQSDALVERVRAFRQNRLLTIIGGDTPTPLSSRTAAVLHIVSANSLEPGFRISLDIDKWLSQLSPPGASRGFNRRINFDGVLTYSSAPNEPAPGYLQLFRNAIVEAVSSDFMSEWQGRKVIRTRLLESELVRSVAGYLRVIEGEGASRPFFVMMSLIGVKDYNLEVPETHFSSDNYPVDRDVLILPELLVEEGDNDIPTMMKPAFDAIWNAGGWSRSLSYDAEGKWSGVAN